MATNHFLINGVKPFTPDYNFGLPISFSSKNRYYTGRESLLAYFRTGQKITEEQIITLLREVTDGQTEHSVIWAPKDKSFKVSNANTNADLWDAPYLNWTQFSFEELFQ